MKKIATYTQILLLNMRGRIESVLSVLKERLGLITSLPRSENGYLAHFKQTKFRGKYRIQSTRLKKYDYSSDGAYFSTICTKNRKYYFGQIIDGTLSETEQSKICTACWLNLPNHYANCVLDAFVIMPNHIHGIIFIQNDDAFPVVSTGTEKRYAVSEIIRGFKTFTARKINDSQNTHGKPFWESRFYDHIIRNNEELNRIRDYIFNNPFNWENDQNNLTYLDPRP